MLVKIQETLKQYNDELKDKYHIKDIGIFGSYLRGEETEESDIDILVEFEPDARMDLIRFIELEEDLSELLGAKVDLVMKSALKPRIGERVLKEVTYL